MSDNSCPYCGSDKTKSVDGICISVHFECGSSKHYGLPSNNIFINRTKMCLYVEKLVNEIKDLKKCIDPFVWDV